MIYMIFNSFKECHASTPSIKMYFKLLFSETSNYSSFVTGDLSLGIVLRQTCLNTYVNV